MKTNDVKRIAAKKLKGHPNKKEKKALRLLRDWHKKAGKKKGFSGKLSRGGCRGYPQKGREDPSLLPMIF